MTSSGPCSEEEPGVAIWLDFNAVDKSHPYLKIPRTEAIYVSTHRQFTNEQTGSTLYGWNVRCAASSSSVHNLTYLSCYKLCEMLMWLKR